MKAYSYGHDHIFNGEIECRLDPLEKEINDLEVYLLPANATFTPVPDFDPEIEYAVFDDEAWVIRTIEIVEPEDPGPQEPSTEERLAIVEGENKLLRAQLQAQTDRSDFIEECIAEMATMVYV